MEVPIVPPESAVNAVTPEIADEFPKTGACCQISAWPLNPFDIENIDNTFFVYNTLDGNVKVY